MNEAEAPAASLARCSVMVPLLPTPGGVVIQPVDAVEETYVVPVGRGSVSVTFCASLGPLFVRVTV